MINLDKLQHKSDNILTVSIFLSIVAVVSGIAFQTHSKQKFEQKQTAILIYAQQLSNQKNYSACVNTAAKIPAHSNSYTDAQTLGTICQNLLSENNLKQAKQLAAKGQFAQALNLISQIPQGDLYLKAQNLTLEWSNRLLIIAQEYYDKPDNPVENAIAIAAAIAENSSVYGQAQDKIRQWQKELGNKKVWQNIHLSLERDDFSTALAQAQKIVVNHEFWLIRRNDIIKEIQRRKTEKQHEKTWQTAVQLLAAGEPQNAIYHAQKLPDTHPWQERKTQIVEQAQSNLRRTKACQHLLFGLWDCRSKLGSKEVE